jgi:hypothetical protein
VVLFLMIGTGSYPAQSMIGVDVRYKAMSL